MQPTIVSSSAHILVVDDEPEIVASLTDYLERTAGYRISAAQNGDDAIAILAASVADSARPVDLVLTDMWMPDKGGLEILAWLRRHPRLAYTRVVMLTAASGNDDKIEALSAGADDYITKPYYPQELLARVKTILRTQQLEKQLHTQSAQLSALNRVSQSVTAVLDVPAVLETAVAGAIDILDAGQAAIYLHQSSDGQLRCQAVYPPTAPPPEAWPSVPVGRGVVGLAFQKGERICVDDTGRDRRYQPNVDGPSALAVNGILVAPLIVRERPVGVLSVLNRQEGRFGALDADMLTSLARTISRAIENAWLFQSVQQRQQALLESRNTLQAVIDGILHPIYMIDAQWRLVAVNEEQAAMLGAPASALAGRPCYQVLFDSDTPCDHCQAAVTLAGDGPQTWSVRWRDDERRTQEWDVSAYPIPGRTRAVVVWQDRTEERRLEQSLLQAGKLAAIGQLAAGVAHEINNPLTAINANAQMLQLQVPGNSDMAEAVDLIVRAGDRAAKVVRNLLDFARQEQYAFETGDVNSSIIQALSLVAYQLRSANIAVNQYLGQEMPPVVASWDHIKSVWINLIINARDAVRETKGERQISITTRLAPDGEAVEIVIADNGVGIAPGELAHIFEPFYTTKVAGQGTGLGLATCQRIVQQHGGAILVDSDLAAGTAFTVRLPAVVEPFSDSEAAL